MCVISTQVESAVLRRLKLLKRLQEGHLSPADGLALLQRLATNSCSADDYERLMKVIRATTEVSEHLLEEPSVPGPPWPERTTKHKRRVAKASRRRNRR